MAKAFVGSNPTPRTRIQIVSLFRQPELRLDFQFIPIVSSDIQKDRVPALPKFMQTLNDQMYRELEKIAKKRGVTVQELIRAVVLPEWMIHQKTDKQTP